MLEILEAIKWPLTVVVVSLIFRRPISNMIAKLAKLRYKDLELWFKKELDELELKVQETPSQQKSSLSEKYSPELKAELENLRTIASISPRAAIVEAWRKVEMETQSAAKRLDIPVLGKIAGTQTFEKLVSYKVIDPDMLSIYSNIRKLRNKAAHATDFDLNYEEGIRYVELALWLAERLRQIKTV